MPEKTKTYKPMTRCGFERLAAEHEELRTKERPKVLQGIQVAAAEGDRSENAEYIYGRKRLRDIDRRLRYLNDLLKDVQVVDPTTLSGDRVSFGATVTVVDDSGAEKIYTIVGEGEADQRPDGISLHSPMAKALLGKRIGDVVTVRRPKGDVDLEVLAIGFGQPGVRPE